jgi:hypothetical protein
MATKFLIPDDIPTGGRTAEIAAISFDADGPAISFTSGGKPMLTTISDLERLARSDGFAALIGRQVALSAQRGAVVINPAPASNPPAAK